MPNQLLQGEQDHGQHAQSMVQRQVRARGVTSPAVLRAMRTVPRHLFVADRLQDRAYNDEALPTRNRQTISQPYIVALMSELLDVAPGHRVLEIGTGSGYQTAILAQLAGEVVTVERDTELSEDARHILARLGITNVDVRAGDGTLGAPDRAPFDRIIVTAGAPSVPQPLREQLADGGRMVVPVGDDAVQQLTVIVRDGDAFDERRGIGCRFVPLVGEHGWKHGRTGP